MNLEWTLKHLGHGAGKCTAIKDGVPLPKVKSIPASELEPLMKAYNRILLLLAEYERTEGKLSSKKMIAADNALLDEIEKLRRLVK